MRTKLSIAAQEDRADEAWLDKLAREDDEWVATMEREAEACHQCIIQLKSLKKPTKAVEAFELKVLAERLAHEASKLQKTLEKGNKV